MKRKLLGLGGGLGVVIALVYLFPWSFGRGGRAFFSPDTLESRGQSEILFPPTELPLYRSAFRYYRYKLVDYLVEKGYWTPQETDHPRWMLMFQWNDQWRDGYTLIYTELKRHGEWIEWSESHPEMASVVWPQVLAILRSNSRHAEGCATELLRLAGRASSLEELKASVASDIEMQEMCCVRW